VTVERFYGLGIGGVKKATVLLSYNDLFDFPAGKTMIKVEREVRYAN
jgi:hypothetical protein